MQLKLITGRSGSGKTEACLTQISEILEQAPQGSPLIFLLPEQATFQMEKKLASRLPAQGFLRAHILGFRRFSHRILQEAGGNWLPPLSDAGRHLILGRILRNRKDELKVLYRAAKQPRFADILSELVQEFRTHKISPSSLKDTANQLPDSPLKDKLTDLSLLYGDFLTFMEDRYRDGNDALDRTVMAIPDCAWLENAQIWVDGFERFTPQEWALLQALLKKVDGLTVTLTLDDPLEAFKENSLFYRSGQSYRQFQKLAQDNLCSLTHQSLPFFQRSKNSALAHIEKHLYGESKIFSEATNGLNVITAANPRLEIIHIARDMLQKVRSEGYRWRDLGLVLRQPDSYRELAEKIFEEYQIPYYRDQSIQPLHHPVIELLRSSLEVLLEGWLPEPLFRAAKTGLMPVEEDALDQLENLVLEFGLKGKKRWEQAEPWQYIRRYALEEDTLPDDDEITRLDLLDRTRRALAGPLLTLALRLKKAPTVKEKAVALYGLWEELGLEARLEGLALDEERENKPEEARLHRQIGNEILAILEELAELLGTEELSLKDFYQLLTDGFEGLSIRLIPPGLDHVMISALDGPISTGLRAVYLPGANDGLFPARSRPEGLLSENDRLLLMDQGLFLAPSGLSDAFHERFIAYRGLTSGTDSICLSYALADREGNALSPSPLVSRLTQLFPNLVIKQVQINEDWLETNPAHVLFRPAPAFASLSGALRRMRDQDLVAPFWTDYYNWALHREPWKQRLSSVVSNLLGTNSSKQLPSSLALDLYAPKGSIRGSVTRLEAFQSCPFKHFAQYGLRLKERPEFQLAAPQVGVFLHGVLKKYGQTLLDEGKKWHEISSDERQQLTDLIIQDLASKLQNEILYSTAQYRHFLERLKETVTRSIDRLTAFSTVTSFAPAALEQSFGDPENGWPALTFELSGDIKLELTGQIDRIDKVETNSAAYFLIIDYKSGSKRLTLSDAYHGLSLQLLTYLLVALEGASHLTNSNSAPHTAGILYYFLRSPFLSTDGPLTIEEAQSQLENSQRMPGWLLENKELLELIESEFAEEGTSFIPRIVLKKNGDFDGRYTKPLKSEEEFAELLSHLEATLVASGQSICAGNVEIAPYQIGSQIACTATFCPYRSFCQFDRFQGNNYRQLETLKDEEIFARLKAEVNPDELDN